MQQDGEAQPPGRGRDQVGDAACDEPVEEDDAAVRQVPEHAGEVRVRARCGTRPRPRDRVLAHLPAEGGQLAAHPAVVGVAAARRGRVVDAAGHDDVHHAGRRPAGGVGVVRGANSHRERS
jgi:hypothetical protein